jgi:hypothetical protein
LSFVVIFAKVLERIHGRAAAKPQDYRAYEPPQGVYFRHAVLLGGHPKHIAHVLGALIVKFELLGVRDLGQGVTKHLK